MLIGERDKVSCAAGVGIGIYGSCVFICGTGS